MSTIVLQPYNRAKLRRKAFLRDYLLRIMIALALCVGAGLVVVKQYGAVIVPPAVDAARAVIGPEAMAWVEAQVYNGAEMFQRTRQNLGLQQAEQAPWTSPDASSDDSSGFVAVIVPTNAATTTPSPSATDTPTSTSTSTATASATNSPTATITPSVTPTTTKKGGKKTATTTKTPRSTATAHATPSAKAGASKTSAVTITAGAAPQLSASVTPVSSATETTTVPPTVTAKPKATKTKAPTQTPVPTEVPAAPSETAFVATASATSEPSIATVAATEIATAPPTATVQNKPTSASAASATATSGTPTATGTPYIPPAIEAGAPASLPLFINDGQLPGEGVWTSAGLPTNPGSGAPGFYKTFIRPNPDRPYAQVYMVSFRPQDIKLHMVAGQQEPVSASPVYRQAQIDPADYSSLVGAFNGGWKSVHGAYGMMVNGLTIAPPVASAATVAVHANGKIDIGPWSRIGAATDIVSYRQNCPMLIDNGVLGYDQHTVSTWGLSLLDEMYVWRSGLGMTADGRLVYVAGAPISAEEMAWAMQRAGVVNAMQLDINSAWVHWVIYDHNDKNEIRARPLVSTMTVSNNQYFNPVDRDFFYLTWR